jgi:hypothetical protein
MSGLTLDTGALIAIERNDRELITLLKEARKAKLEILIPAGVIAQAWRDGRRQARIARFLSAPQVGIHVLDEFQAKRAGQLCGLTGTDDIVDASVVLCARDHHHRVVTSDSEDIERLAPELDLIEV